MTEPKRSAKVAVAQEALTALCTRAWLWAGDDPDVLADVERDIALVQSAFGSPEKEGTR